MIGLISSVPFEAGLITGSFREGKNKKNPSLVEGSLQGKSSVYICSGIGAANAARTVAILAERKRPEAIIFFGIGGAYPSSGLQKGALAAAEVEIYAGCGLITREITNMAKGTPVENGAASSFKALGFPLLKKGRKVFFDNFPLDKPLLKKAKKCLPELASGTFLTVCATGRSTRKAARLGERHGAIVENMEGAAAAQTALFYGIPLLELRGISNITGEPPSKWLKEEAAVNCQEAVLKLLENW
ncbi:MAG: futalosine hydrolase [Nitrospiraceae bacterium]|nr:futalosine hydrolase [Nitrospiraceae bacterium]